MDQNSDLLESINIFNELFDGKTVKITSQNHCILLILARYFEMASFFETLEEYDIFLQNIESDFIRSDELVFLICFEELIMKLNENNFDEIVVECNEILHRMSRTLFVYCLIQYFALHYDKSLLYLSFLQKIDEINGYKSFEDNESLFNLFFSFLKKTSVLKEKEFNVELFIFYKNLFIHQKKNEINQQNQKINDSIIQAIEKDDVDQLQYFLVQLNVDIDQKIDEIVKNEFLPTKYNMTYIKYTAFKKSIKYFKYLLVNNAKIDQKDFALFAVSGGNNEIIHICEQKRCNFDGTIKLSIKYHHHSITEWLIENDKDNECIGDEFYVKDPLKYCIKYCNFISLKYVISHSCNVHKLLTSSAKFNNEILAQLAIKIIKKYKFNCISLFENEYCPISALHISCVRENIETVKIILESKLIDVNQKYRINMLMFLIIFNNILL